MIHCACPRNSACSPPKQEHEDAPDAVEGRQGQNHQSRGIGDGRLDPLHSALGEHAEIQKLPWLIPHFATEEGRLKMSIHSLVVETPTRRIVVDTGLGNDKQGRNVPTWNNRTTSFRETMIAAGFPPESIDTVLCTHLHVDHVGWNTKWVDGKWVPTFPNARYVFGKTEYEHWRDHSTEPDKRAVFGDSVEPIVDAERAEL